MSKLIDVAVVDKELRGQPEEVIDGAVFQRVYLGTVFAILPSGKYHTSWCNSNATTEDLTRDDDWRTKVDAELETINAVLVSGEDDPCDLYVERYVRPAQPYGIRKAIAPFVGAE